MTLYVDDAALEDLDAAAAWYDSRQPEVGDRLLAEFDRILSQIESNPRAFPRLEYPEDLDPRVRRALLKRFPYIVIFMLTDEHIHVIAVEHTSRKPGRWLPRLTDS